MPIEPRVPFERRVPRAPGAPGVPGAPGAPAEPAEPTEPAAPAVPEPPREELWIFPYDREAAVAYAHKWAFARNPDFYDYQYIGGDCTNFASQCLYAGTGVMNYTPTYGWYYIDANQKAPAWTGVPYFYNFLTRSIHDRGPFGINVPITDIEPGDFVQLNFNGEIFAHTPVIVSVGYPPTFENVLVAAHSVDVDNTPLTEFPHQEIRFIHILGFRA